MANIEKKRTIYDYIDTKIYYEEEFNQKNDHTNDNDHSNEGIKIREIFCHIKQSIIEHENKEVIVGYTLMMLFMIYGFVMTGEIIFSIYFQRNSYLFISPLSIIISVVGPIITFCALTYYEYWNFHNRKMLLFSIPIINGIINIIKMFTMVYGIIIRPIVFMIPLSHDNTPEFIMMIARILNTAIIIAITMPLLMYTYKILNSDEMKDIIFKFQIRQVIDLRKNKKFAYDMKCVKNLDTGKKYVIKEKDRSLHGYAEGGTGTSKTAGTLTPSITDDLDQKVFNTDYCKKVIKKALDENIVAVKRSFEDIDFSINNYIGLNETGEKLLKDLKSKAPSAGITCMAPNESFADEIYELATNRGFKVNRVDPMTDKDGNHKPGFKGFNPLYISPQLNDKEREIDIFKKAKLFADVLQAIYDMSGTSDAYFAKLNKNITVAFTILLEVTMPYVNPGHQVTPDDVQDLVCNFDKVRPYYEELLKHYSNIDVFDSNGQIDFSKMRHVNCGRYQFIVPVLNNDVFNQKGREQLENQIRGLRTIMSDFINHPLIHDVFCVQDSIDLDKMLSDGEITVVNYAQELGTVESTAFGMFFSLSFNNAVLRRPGTENTRLLHFYYIDEFPLLLHKDHAIMFSLFRQFKVCSFVAFQNLSQFDQNPTTRYIRGVLLNNVGHQIVFGRVSVDEMDTYSKLCGKEMKIIEQLTFSETALTDPDTKLSMSSRTTPTFVNAREGKYFRYKGFQEVSVFTVNEGVPLEEFAGKVSFLSKKRRKYVAKRYQVDWKKYCVYDDSNIIEMPIFEDEVKLTGTDGFSLSSEVINTNAECKVIESTLNNHSEKNNMVEFPVEHEIQKDNKCYSINISNVHDTLADMYENNIVSILDEAFPDEDESDNEEELLLMEQNKKIEEELSMQEEYEQEEFIEHINGALLDSDADSSSSDTDLDFGFGVIED